MWLKMQREKMNKKLAIENNNRPTYIQILDSTVKFFNKC